MTGCLPHRGPPPSGSERAELLAEPLGELVDLWIERRAASDKPISPDTVEDYRSLIAKKIKPALGSKRLHTVNARVLDAFYDDLRRYGNAKAGAYESALTERDAPADVVRASLAGLERDVPVVNAAKGTYKQRVFAGLAPHAMVIREVGKMFKPPAGK